MDISLLVCIQARQVNSSNAVHRETMRRDEVTHVSAFPLVAWSVDIARLKWTLTTVMHCWRAHRRLRPTSYGVS